MFFGLKFRSDLPLLVSGAVAVSFASGLVFNTGFFYFDRSFMTLLTANDQFNSSLTWMVAVVGIVGLFALYLGLPARHLFNAHAASLRQLQGSDLLWKIRLRVGWAALFSLLAWVVFSMLHLHALAGSIPARASQLATEAGDMTLKFFVSGAVLLVFYRKDGSFWAIYLSISVLLFVAAVFSTIFWYGIVTLSAALNDRDGPSVIVVFDKADIPAGISKPNAHEFRFLRAIDRGVLVYDKTDDNLLFFRNEQVKTIEI
ncbi:MAG TPA: hypothetical protein VGG48_17495 [Rhizomicrobium sp.]|jgi:hypothetical protein